MLVTVSAELPIDAATYLLERDGAAFRSFIAEVGQPEPVKARTMEMPAIWDKSRDENPFCFPPPDLPCRK